MVRLTDDELAIVMHAAQPLLPGDRGPFLQQVARALESMPADAIGPGSVARIVRGLQREHFAAPTPGRSMAGSKYR
jgi:hypothetical protein